MKKEEQLLLKNKVESRKTMKLSVKEGAAASVMVGLTNDYVTPYALTLNANNAQIGFLSSFAGLISPISQIFGSKLMEKHPRRKIIVFFVILHALMLLPILSLSLLFWKNIFVLYLPIILIIFYSVYAIFGAMGGPSWFSLLGDIVPEKIRGRYFGKRNKICGIVAITSTVIAAFTLDYFKTRGYILIGFSILFLSACVARLISAKLLSKHYEPKLELEKDYYFSFYRFLKLAPKSNFGKFVIFTSLMFLTVNIAGPFFSVYMLKELKFSFATYMLINVSGAVFSFLFMPLWGKFSDKYGNRELLKIGSILIPINAILWIFSPSPYYLIFIPQLLSGMGWSAFGLSVSNFIYDSIEPQRRAICVTYFNILNGVGVFLGASLGGLLAHYLTLTFMNKFLFLFLISGILRALITITIFPRIKEVRKTKKIKSNPLSYIKEIKPIYGIIYGIIDDVKGVKRIISKRIK